MTNLDTNDTDETVDYFDLETILKENPLLLFSFPFASFDVSETLNNLLNQVQSYSYSEVEEEILFDSDFYIRNLEAVIRTALEFINFFVQHYAADKHFITKASDEEKSFFRKFPMYTTLNHFLSSALLHQFTDKVPLSSPITQYNVENYLSLFTDMPAPLKSIFSSTIQQALQSKYQTANI